MCVCVSSHGPFVRKPKACPEMVALKRWVSVYGESLPQGSPVGSSTRENVSERARVYNTRPPFVLHDHSVRVRDKRPHFAPIFEVPI